MCAPLLPSVMALVQIFSSIQASVLLKLNYELDFGWLVLVGVFLSNLAKIIPGVLKHLQGYKTV